jgi:hypothetical protein
MRLLFLKMNKGVFNVQAVWSSQGTLPMVHNYPVLYVICM